MFSVPASVSSVFPVAWTWEPLTATRSSSSTPRGESPGSNWRPTRCTSQSTRSSLLYGPRDPSMSSRLTLVTAIDCHLCDHARNVARRLASDFAINIDEISWESPEADQVRRDGVPFPPALYAGDQLLGYGRISERGVRRRLTNLK